MTWSFWVPGRLPGANETIAAAKGYGGRGYGYSKLKKKLTNDIALIVRGARVPKLQRVYLRYEWHEPEPPKVGCIGKRPRDPGNIAAGQKFVEDGLVTAGTITNDTLAQIVGFSHDFVVGGRVGVLVTVEDRSPLAGPCDKEQLREYERAMVAELPRVDLLKRLQGDWNLEADSPDDSK